MYVVVEPRDSYAIRNKVVIINHTDLSDGLTNYK